ncbi:DNA polymerase III subunit beta [Sanyastnella coralliicola]|uniref:DNA polymerase III subunit beta n=1 Tax=Sanyastnella coralliicola TaxID=3069118 RepID=UPI0027B99007|nr:DNA polymerase III subunit beta [Longitalea sp. SCSIO 12813]
MKFVVASDKLHKQLQLLSGVLNSSNTLPILDNFLFELSPNKATISASDLETTMTTAMEVMTDDEASIAIPAKLLIDTLKSFGSSSIPLTFKIDEKSLAIEVTSDQGRYKLAGANGSEFPKAPAIESDKSFDMDGGVLSSAINRSLFAAGNDDLRPVMSGLFFEIHEDKMHFVATDAHRLVRYTRSDVQAGAAGSFIVPKKPLNLLKNVVAGADKVTVTYSESNAHFAFDDISLMCRLIDGKYPNYEAVIPKDNPNKLTVNRDQMSQSIRRVSLFANKTTHQVRLKIAGSELHISAEDLDFANSAIERMSCNYTGEDMEIGFNSRFILDMLSNISTDEVVLELSAPNRAGILLPGEVEEEGEDILMLVMPVMLNS